MVALIIVLGILLTALVSGTVVSLFKRGIINKKYNPFKKKPFLSMRGRTKDGLTLFAFDRDVLEIYKTPIRNKTDLEKKTLGGDGNYLVDADRGYEFFWALNIRNATRKAAKMATVEFKDVSFHPYPYKAVEEEVCMQ